jgi:hypothetical protein
MDARTMMHCMHAVGSEALEWRGGKQGSKQASKQEEEAQRNWREGDGDTSLCPSFLTRARTTL